MGIEAAPWKAAQVHQIKRKGEVVQTFLNPKIYRGQVLVGSEIYDARLTPVILTALDQIAMALAAPAA